MKQCNRCGADFEARTNARYCVPCRPLVPAEKVSQWRAANPGAFKKWYKKNHKPKPKRVIHCPDCGSKFTPVGRQLRCDPCVKRLHLEKARAWKRKSRDRLRAYDLRWRRDNPEKILDMNQRNRYAQNWRRALARDGHKCTVCGSSSKLVVHHRDGRGRTHCNPNHELSNLQTMCRRCHAAHHRTEARRAV